MLRISAAELRRELGARTLRLAERIEHETTFGAVASVIYAEQGDGTGHGSFLSASCKRICGDADWRRRLEKAYTAGERVARRHDRWRAELDCANSSDALLMNLFC